MRHSHARCFKIQGQKKRRKKGQMKIQEMSFVLVAFMIFFVIAGLFAFAYRSLDVKEDVVEQRAREALETARKVATLPEFSFGSCSSCIDSDKALVLKERKSYGQFFDVNVLKIEFLYPEKQGECTLANYPDCRTITIVDQARNESGILEGVFAAVCRTEFQHGSRHVCEWGKVYASGRSVK